MGFVHAGFVDFWIGEGLILCFWEGFEGLFSVGGSISNSKSPNSLDVYGVLDVLVQL